VTFCKTGALPRRTEMFLALIKLIQLALLRNLGKCLRLPKLPVQSGNLRVSQWNPTAHARIWFALRQRHRICDK
jgi:hypothetical protein